MATLREWAGCLDAARSWGGSAVLGVPPMSDCRGFPHDRAASLLEVLLNKIS
ncbi:MAG: hypothetical protein F6K55_34835 [Moorea sp. SIO4A3]|nr:hypothetical protein [Moorena sp. SIO4A3]